MSAFASGAVGLANAHKSNVVVIPKEDIVEALKGLPPALRDARCPF